MSAITTDEIQNTTNFLVCILEDALIEVSETHNVLKFATPPIMLVPGTPAHAAWKAARSNCQRVVRRMQAMFDAVEKYRTP